MAYKFEIIKDKAGKFRFHMVAPNGQIMFQSQGYTKKQSAVAAIESIKKNAPKAVVTEP